MNNHSVSRKPRAPRMKKRRKIPNLTIDQRAQLAPALKEWASATASLLQALHSGAYGVRHRHRLSSRYRERLEAKRRKAQASGARCQATKPFGALPPYSQQKALNMKLVLDANYAAVADGLTAGYAESVARALSVLIFDKAIHSRTLRRKIARVERGGAPELAPIEAFADELSVPHRNALKEAA